LPEQATIVESINCNGQDSFKAPPMDSVIILYLFPLFSQLVFKPKKSIVFLNIAMSIVSVAWGIIRLKGWANLFIVYYSVFPFMIAYESERALMELFVRSNDILSEISKREKAEVELAHNENLKYLREVCTLTGLYSRTFGL
jgi:hypothetical protein